MNKLTKCLVSGMAIIGCAIGLSGCGFTNHSVSQMNALNGSYSKNLPSNNSSNGEVLCHIENGRIYTQPIQSGLHKKIQQEIKGYNAYVGKALSQAPKNMRPSGKEFFYLKEKAFLDKAYDQTLSNQCFYANSVTKKGDTYRIHGHTVTQVATTPTAKQLRPINKDRIQLKDKKSKATTVILKKSALGLTIVPKHKSTEKSTSLPSISNMQGRSLLKEDGINNSQDGYES